MFVLSFVFGAKVGQIVILSNKIKTIRRNIKYNITFTENISYINHTWTFFKE